MPGFLGQVGKWFLRLVGLAVGLFIVLVVGVVVWWWVSSNISASEARVRREEYQNMQYDANNLEKLSFAFFTQADRDTGCVKRLDSMKWERRGDRFEPRRFKITFIYHRDGYEYDFFYVNETDDVDPYHLTVRVHTVEGYKYLYSAALHGNQFGEGIGEPTFDSKWKALLDDDVREGLERVVPESEQDKWNKKVLEEYTGILQCFFNEQQAERQGAVQ